MVTTSLNDKDLNLALNLDLYNIYLILNHVNISIEHKRLILPIGKT